MASFWDLPKNSPKYYQDKIRYDAILKYLPKTAHTILDLGCGDGYLSYLLSKQGKKVTGADLSQKRLQKFEHKAKLHNIFRVQTDVTKAGLAADAFDAIICSEVIEHIEHFEEVLNEAFRLIKPDGYFLVTVPYKEYIKTIVCPHCQRAFNQDGHFHRFEKENLTQALKAAGFKILKTETFRHRFLTHMQYHFKIKYGPSLRTMDRLFSMITPGFTWYLLALAQKAL